jgi:hypothetical protein
MAPITPGTTGTCNATTIEGTLFQLSSWVEQQERYANEEGKFSFSKDDSFIMSATFTLPASLTRNATDGTFLITASPWLPSNSSTFNAGTGGTIKGTTFSQFFIDSCLYALTLQNNGAKNPQGLKYVELSCDLDELEWTGTLTIPYVSTIGTSGAVIETASEWLLA